MNNKIIKGMTTPTPQTTMKAIKHDIIENKFIRIGLILWKFRRSMFIKSLVNLFNILPDGTLLKNSMIPALIIVFTILFNKFLFLVI